MHSIRNWFCLACGAVLLGLTFAGCQALREITALRQVNFVIDRVEQPRLAGVDVQRVRSYEDLTPNDLLSVGRAVSRGEMPFAFTLVINAENPADNPVQARMVTMDWTLLLDDNETVSGRFEDNIVLPPGEPQDVPLELSLDLLEFFDQNARALVDLALAVAGREGEPRRVELQATPTIDTPIGPIQYPNPIIIVSREVGGGS